MFFEKINLQMFGGPVAYDGNTTTTGELNNLGDGHWGGSGMLPEIKTFYDKRLIDLAGPQLVHNQFGQKKPIPKGGGKTIEFRKFKKLGKALEPLTEGVTPDGQSLSVSTLTATVEQYGGYVSLTDMLQMTALDPIVSEAVDQIGEQAGLTLDTITREVLAGATNVIFAGGVDERNKLEVDNEITVNEIRRAVATLRGQNAPTINGKYVAVIHPYAAHALMSDPNFVEWHKYARPEELYAGELGEICGVRFVSTTEAKIFPKASKDGKSVYSTLILANNAYGVTDIEGGGLQTIIKQLGSGEDPLNQRSTVGWKATATAERLVEEYMVRIESCCKDFPDEVNVEDKEEITG